jgi:lipopolysaccharide/colanic/teichoic acid biosynthesis glycosyltransferase
MDLPMDWIIINRPKLHAANALQQLDLVVIRRTRVIPPSSYYQTVKRVMDVTLCLLALPLILPITIICAAIIHLDSSGPIFFVQERIGRGGRPFRLYKFRTMQHKLDDTQHRAFMKAFVNGQINHSAHGQVIFKPVQASEITKVGRILRKTSLDELPQVINVLKGEMSLVGPRPNVPWEVEEYRLRHHERLEVLPGITGLAQVHGRSGIPFETIIKYDIEYVAHRSLFTDLKILVWTFASIVMGSGSG